MDAILSNSYIQLAAFLFCIFNVYFQVRDLRKQNRLYDELEAKCDRLEKPNNLFRKYWSIQRKRGFKKPISMWRRIYIRKKAIKKLLST